MILMPHSTRCPACGRLLYAMDDLFAVRLWLGEEEIPGAPPGMYHYACFLGLPGRDEYLRRDAGTTNRVLDEESEYFTVLARTSAFALALRPVIETFVLYFIQEGRQFSFRGAAAWRQFLSTVAGPDLPRPTPPNSAGPLRVRRDEDFWELATRQLVPIEADFPPPDFDRLRQSLSGRGIDPARSPVALGVVCEQLGITPTRISSPLDRLTGTFTWPEVPSDPARPVTLTVQVEKWYAVRLGGAEMEELRRFLRGLNGSGA
jgi:hypothetical protein